MPPSRWRSSNGVPMKISLPKLPRDRDGDMSIFDVEVRKSREGLALWEVRHPSGNILPSLLAPAPLPCFDRPQGLLSASPERMARGRMCDRSAELLQDFGCVLDRHSIKSTIVARVPVVETTSCPSVIRLDDGLQLQPRLLSRHVAAPCGVQGRVLDAAGWRGHVELL